MEHFQHVLGGDFRCSWLSMSGIKKQTEEE